MNVGDAFIPRSVVHHGHKFYATTNNLLNIGKRIQLDMATRDDSRDVVHGKVLS